MAGLDGPRLDPAEREWLRHPALGGVILFARNAAPPADLAALTREIHALRSPPLLIAVDHEGGRVQRFREAEGFTRLPPAGRLGALDRSDPARAEAACASLAWLLNAELRAVGIDFSFAPVLDLDWGLSEVIGDRALGQDPERVIALGAAWIRGAHAAGAAAVGKHFPGHGAVIADSHRDLPVDPRAWERIAATDLRPFARLIAAAPDARGLDAVMTAHVLYPELAPEPAGFSPFWVRGVLRERLGFTGAVCSDDLGMAGAAIAGDMIERTRQALAADSDLVLICNDRAALIEVLDAWHGPRLRVLAQVAGAPDRQARLARLRGGGDWDRDRLRVSPAWRDAVRHLAGWAAPDQAMANAGLVDPTDY